MPGGQHVFLAHSQQRRKEPIPQASEEMPTIDGGIEPGLTADAHLIAVRDLHSC